jgi:hypothetical protein
MRSDAEYVSGAMIDPARTGLIECTRVGRQQIEGSTSSCPRNSRIFCGRCTRRYFEFQGMIGTVLSALNGEPFTILELMAR